MGKLVKLLPEPVRTRWNSWFEVVEYHAEYFDNYLQFVEEEIEEASTTDSAALRRLAENLDPANAAQLLACIKFVSENTKRLLKQLEGQEHYAVVIHNMMHDLYAAWRLARAGITAG